MSEFKGASGPEMEMVVGVTGAGIGGALIKVVGRDDKRAFYCERAPGILIDVALTGADGVATGLGVWRR